MAKDPIPLLPYLSQVSSPTTTHLTLTAVNRHHSPATPMPHLRRSPQPLREALRRLCCDHGWSYASLYRPCPGDHRLLRMEECYYEEQLRTIVDKMRNRVHVVGEGSLGAAAASGKHQWIYSDTCCRDLTSPTNAGDSLDMFPGGADSLHQFIAGIKTIAIVSIPSFGVIQFGSSQKIPESSKFLDQVHYVFWQLETMTGLFQDLDVQQSMNSPDTPATFASVILSGDAYSSNKNISNSNENVCQIRLANAPSSTDPTQPPSLFSRGFYDGSRYHDGGVAHHVSPMSEASSSISESISFNNFTSRNSSLHLENQSPADGTEAIGLLSAKTHVHSNSFFPKSSLASYTSANMCAKEVSNLPTEGRLLSGMTLQGYHTTLPTKSHFSIPYPNTFHCLGGGSSESCSLYESQGDLSTEKPLSKESPFALELPDNIFSFPEDLKLEHSQLVHSLDDRVIDITHSGDQPLKQLSNVLTVPMNNDLLSIRRISSGLAGGDSLGCSGTIKLPSIQVEDSTACAVNSLNTGSDFNTKSSNGPDLLLSDHDLFDGMDLDLIPRVLRQDNWDDIVMPLGSGICSNLSISIPEYTDIGLPEDADNRFFPESTLELLDAVVTGNVNLSASDSYAPTTVNAVVGLDSELHLSKSTTAGSQGYRNQLTPLCHPSFIRTSDITLPEYRLQKITEGSPKETFSKSHVSSCAEDSCSMKAESSVINQPRNPEENAKVSRKRARPGENTRPRPKDRQQIQDRVKELREIVPNGGKCSIDSLLDRTIKHMLFLQSVTKYADKLRQADEPKMIGNESGVVLKDNLSSSGGGATWAYEVAGQTMVCPILVEDLNPPGQMLVEMRCEDRGFFLEIADVIRGFGLTILKGVMEIRDGKIWARFMVEANRDVTRMDIFLSLVQLLQQTSCSRSSEQPAKFIDKGVPELISYQQSPVPIPISLADGLK